MTDTATAETPLTDDSRVDEVLIRYAEHLRAIYLNETAGSHTFLGVLATFATEMQAVREQRGLERLAKAVFEDDEEDWDAPLDLTEQELKVISDALRAAARLGTFTKSHERFALADKVEAYNADPLDDVHPGDVA